MGVNRLFQFSTGGGGGVCVEWGPRVSRGS